MLYVWTHPCYLSHQCKALYFLASSILANFVDPDFSELKGTWRFSWADGSVWNSHIHEIMTPQNPCGDECMTIIECEIERRWKANWGCHYSQAKKLGIADQTFVHLHCPVAVQKPSMGKTEEMLLVAAAVTGKNGFAAGVTQKLYCALASILKLSKISQWVWNSRKLQEQQKSIFFIIKIS